MIFFKLVKGVYFLIYAFHRSIGHNNLLEKSLYLRLYTTGLGKKLSSGSGNSEIVLINILSNKSHLKETG